MWAGEMAVAAEGSHRYTHTEKHKTYIKCKEIKASLLTYYRIMYTENPKDYTTKLKLNEFSIHALISVAR